LLAAGPASNSTLLLTGSARASFATRFARPSGSGRAGRGTATGTSRSVLRYAREHGRTRKPAGAFQPACV
jgi:hypothetical protein